MTLIVGLTQEMNETTDSPCLQPEEIAAEVFKRLERYKDLNMHEQYAMFMGMAQILEFGLKNLLSHRSGIDVEKMKRWTMGTVRHKLAESGLRDDFIALLKGVVDHRNYIAHEFLANDTMIRAITGGDSGRLEIRNLEHAVYELEQIMFLHDWCVEHDAWDYQEEPNKTGGR